MPKLEGMPDHQSETNHSNQEIQLTGWRQDDKHRWGQSEHQDAGLLEEIVDIPDEISEMSIALNENEDMLNTTNESKLIPRILDTSLAKQDDTLEPQIKDPKPVDLKKQYAMALPCLW